MPHSQPLPFSADAIVDTVREPMLVLSADLRVRRANRSFYRTFKVTPEETVDRLVYDLGNQQWDIPWLRKLLEEVLPQDTAFDDFEVEHVFPDIGRKYMLLNARRICGKDNQTEFILLAIEDTTERRLAEEAKREISRIRPATFSKQVAMPKPLQSASNNHRLVIQFLTLRKACGVLIRVP